MKIDWRVIPHSQQNYPTVGNWWLDDKATLHLRVSSMSDPRYELLVGIHELIEALLCQFASIASSDVDAFDEGFERIRANLISGNQPIRTLECGCKLEKDLALEYEPGDDPHAPYRRQHQIATVCERALAFFMDVNWSKYEREVESL